MDVLVVQRQDVVQLSAQGYRRDVVLFPIVFVLSIADFCAPFAVERMPKDRLELGSGDSADIREALGMKHARKGGEAFYGRQEENRGRTLGCFLWNSNWCVAA